MQTYIMFLKGINVGKHKQISMLLYKTLDKTLKNEQISLRNWKTTMKMVDLLEK